uniref:EF-hand domain-containing protein n=1 Tax=Palpitomonas bilix TaxID=652834 RepID=A0A7S3GCK8_9EUKA|mmetsp:Transcript_43551/g.113409  ORF Transcript_43551/g.113409 Transcript_43551/m.113409 type:complete len:217 (+) Transcript_43551:263-913(+)|eukprot:CAMPEP_0113880252 /NCGR_PEP_ID=MMETSP0780_2-20120614/7681_1 /TAXON_ID=652834 /ORGANISM="Palpitomonas bilix" /LENGTH=216 /DNA_ID=CAMNT_0000866905 /DNA_START=263 /DNA_END=913 /DNA_ORIENTATION=+ /assembly_acc=CAM_ASM_000599
MGNVLLVDDKPLLTDAKLMKHSYLSEEGLLKLRRRLAEMLVRGEAASDQPEARPLDASGGNPFVIPKDKFLDAAKDVGLGDFSKDIRPLIERLLDAFDRSGYGAVEPQEVLVGMAALSRGKAMERLELAFTIFDTLEKQCIDAEELSIVMRSMATALAEVISPGCIDRIGGIDIEEIRPYAQKVVVERGSVKSQVLPADVFADAVLSHPLLRKITA